MRNDITKVKKKPHTEFIKSALKSLGMATKAQIADTTGISVATCGKIPKRTMYNAAHRDKSCYSGDVY